MNINNLLNYLIKYNNSTNKDDIFEEIIEEIDLENSYKLIPILTNVTITEKLISDNEYELMIMSGQSVENIIEEIHKRKTDKELNVTKFMYKSNDPYI